MTILNRINYFVEKGFTSQQSESLVAQEILIEKISSSTLVDKVLLKGGVLMYCLTKNDRRASRDLDFDLIRYDISSDESIELFIKMLNDVIPEYKVEIHGKIQTLHQDDYDGKRVLLRIYDKTYSLNIKLDIGVHTLLGIEQETTIFDIQSNNKNVIIHVNPTEQLFAEKMLSLAKHGILSTRFKDIYDVYYLISNNLINKNKFVECIELLLINKPFGISSIDEMINLIIETLDDSSYLNLFKNSKDNWVNVDNKNDVVQSLKKYLLDL